MKLLIALLLATASLRADQTQPKGEPTNAKEAAAKQRAEDKELGRKFAEWKATLPPEQQAWESLLEQCLGSFYLPHYKRDKIAKNATAWDYVKDDPKLPRVLLIGDSISRGYTQAVQRELAGKANVHRAPENCGPTANGLKKLDVWLGQGAWDVIHFNFGIHDRATPTKVYEENLEKIIARLNETKAKLIWASSTPLPAVSKYGNNDAMVERNAIAAGVAKRHAIPVDDLYQFILPRLADLQNTNDVHFGTPGYDVLGKKVATEILVVLNQPKAAGQ